MQRTDQLLHPALHRRQTDMFDFELFHQTTGARGIFRTTPQSSAQRSDSGDPHAASPSEQPLDGQRDALSMVSNKIHLVFEVPIHRPMVKPASAQSAKGRGNPFVIKHLLRGIQQPLRVISASSLVLAHYTLCHFRTHHLCPAVYYTFMNVCIMRMFVINPRGNSVAKDVRPPPFLLAPTTLACTARAPFRLFILLWALRPLLPWPSALTLAGGGTSPPQNLPGGCPQGPYKLAW